MSVRITGPTDDHTVALYDSVTGVAFGKVFSSHTEAISFLDYLASIDEPDPRAMHPADLERFREQWEDRDDA